MMPANSGKDASHHIAESLGRSRCAHSRFLAFCLPKFIILIMSMAV